MTDRHVALESGTYQAAPEWMLRYVLELVKVTQHSRPLRVIVASDEFFSTMPKSAGGAEGACMMLADGGDVIIMPESVQPSEAVFDVLAHEFAHAVHSPIDRLASGKVNDPAYEAAVEAHITLLGGLIQFAAAMGEVRAESKPKP